MITTNNRCFVTTEIDKQRKFVHRITKCHNCIVNISNRSLKIKTFLRIFRKYDNYSKGRGGLRSKIGDF